MKEKFRLAVCQMNVVDNKEVNIFKAHELLVRAAENCAEIAVLPEMFNCPYDSSKFREYSENADNGQTIKAVSKTAKELDMIIVAGSIPEMYEGKIYNSCFVFDKSGELIGRHRKVHLFDVDISEGIAFRESDILSAGSGITVFDTKLCRMGIAVCYDMRFPEMIRLMALKGAKLVIMPAAFNMVTGPAHWELLLRTRALDNQIYTAAASPARDESATYISYGNSMIVGPWGDVISRAAEKENIIYADIDLSTVERIRNELPLLKHRRHDVYDIKEI